MSRIPAVGKQEAALFAGMRLAARPFRLATAADTAASLKMFADEREEAHEFAWRKFRELLHALSFHAFAAVPCYKDCFRGVA